MVVARLMRSLGIFLFVMAGLAALDWAVGMAIFGWPYRIVNLEYYGDLRGLYDPPFPRILIYLPCPGNGFGFLCGPWALLLVFVTVLASATCLTANLVYALRSAGGDSDGSVLPGRPAQIFFVAASVVLFAGFLWTWFIYLAPGSWEFPTGGPVFLEVLSSLMPPLFVIVCVVAGWRLRRESPTG